MAETKSLFRFIKIRNYKDIHNDVYISTQCVA